MKKTLTIGAAAVLAVTALAVPSGAAASPVQAKGIDSLARQDCKLERRTDHREFVAEYGRGGKAIDRCARDQKQEARRDCREDRREEPREFDRVYGSGPGAMNRCMKDEVR